LDNHFSDDKDKRKPITRVKNELITRLIQVLYFCLKKFHEMNTKLTLTIDQALIEKAKEYAKNKGRSLSDIVENYFKAIVKEKGAVEFESTPITDSLRGSFKVPKDFDYKKELPRALEEKYL